jgi:hypothetical protein
MLNVTPHEIDASGRTGNHSLTVSVTGDESGYYIRMLWVFLEQDTGVSQKTHAYFTKLDLGRVGEEFIRVLYPVD